MNENNAGDKNRLSKIDAYARERSAYMQELLNTEPRFKKLADIFEKLTDKADSVEMITANDKSTKVMRVKKEGEEQLFSFSIHDDNNNVHIEKFWFDPAKIIEQRENQGIFVLERQPVEEVDFSKKEIPEMFSDDLWRDFLEYTESNPKRKPFTRSEPKVSSLEDIIGIKKITDLVVGWGLETGAEFSFNKGTEHFQVQYMQDGIMKLREKRGKSSSFSYVRLLPDGLPREIGGIICPLVLIDTAGNSLDVVQESFARLREEKQKKT
jgi:hypothetical protein